LAPSKKEAAEQFLLKEKGDVKPHTQNVRRLLFCERSAGGARDEHIRP
jgi:hypothetical protein